MDNTQLLAICAAIISAGGAIATAIWRSAKWAVGRVVKALDDNAAAFTKQAEAAATHAETLRNVADRVERVEEAVQAVAEWCDQHTGVRDVPHGIRRKPPKEKRADTPAKGVGVGEYRYKRGGTHGDEEV